jgi:hypothetical protein
LGDIWVAGDLVFFFVIYTYLFVSIPEP